MKTLVTYPPSHLTTNPKLRHALVLDWIKVKRILAGEYPSPLPPRQFYSNSEADKAWIDGACTAAFWVVDTEYTMGKPGQPSRLDLIGGYYPGAPYILQYWWGCNAWLDHMFAEQFHRIIRFTPTSFWNAIADIPVIQVALGTAVPMNYGYTAYKRIEDPMLIHALLYSEWRHSLEFVTSTHGQHVKVKHKMAEAMAEYHAGDLAETLVCHTKLVEELNHDKGSRQVYEAQALPLIPIILNSSHTRGIRVGRCAVVEAIRVYQGLVDEAFALARVSCGYSINLRSETQVKEYLYEIAKFQVQKSGKRKAAGSQSKGYSSDADAINALRMGILPFDADYENSEGLSLDYILGRVEGGANMFLEAMALHSYAFATMNTYLYGLCKAVYEELDNNKRKKAREELRSRPVTIEDVCERVYPDVSQHTQANGRWSWTDPPMTGIPKSLHHIFVPDPGHAWLIFDYKRMEPTIDAYLCKDVPTQQAIEAGRDIYKEGTIETFGEYSDPKKKVFKAVKLSLSYGKREDRLHVIPGIMNFGLNKLQLTQAAQRYLSQHPGKVAWMAKKKATVRNTQQSRTPFGRLRWFMGHLHDMEKEGLNHEMQATATDVTNLKIIRMCELLPRAYVVNNRFDELWLDVLVEDLDSSRKTVIEVVAEPVMLGGKSVVFQIDPPNCEVKYAPNEEQSEAHQAV